jgi:phosphatidylserine/phosphatidylglycerophosphate/cardiolipin synthase-like enzyme
MKNKLCMALAALAALFAWLWWDGLNRQTIAADHAAMRAYFSPSGGASKAIVDALDGAAESIFVQAYSFTSEPIAAALARAQRRGVNVQALLDKSNRTDKRSKAHMLRLSGAQVWIDAKHAIAHNKVMVIDKSVIVTGSFNFTSSAEDRNAENLLIVNSPKLAAEYLANWESHKRHSEEY